MEGKDTKGGQKMFTYYLAKARQDQVLREAEQVRLTRATTRAKRGTREHKPSQAKGWPNRLFRATRA